MVLYQSFQVCKCPDGFEGNHCEFLRNQTPDYYTSITSGSVFTRLHAKPTIVTFSCLFLFVVCFALSYTFYELLFRIVKSHMSRSKRIQSAVDRDMHIDADGDLILEVKHEKEINGDNGTNATFMDEEADDLLYL